LTNATSVNHNKEAAMKGDLNITAEEAQALLEYLPPAHLPDHSSIFNFITKIRKLIDLAHDVPAFEVAKAEMTKSFMAAFEQMQTVRVTRAIAHADACASQARLVRSAVASIKERFDDYISPTVRLSDVEGKAVWAAERSKVTLAEARNTVWEACHIPAFLKMTLTQRVKERERLHSLIRRNEVDYTQLNALRQALAKVIADAKPVAS
jgi:hypothetical protein